MPFEITVHEQSFDQNVTAGSLADDLAAAKKAANARAAYDQVLAGDEPTGWSEVEHDHADAAIRAALELVHALGGKDDHFRVTIMQGDDHINVGVQLVDAVEPPSDADEEWKS